MDKFGQGLEFRCSKLDQNKELNLTGFTKQMLLEMCILSGCDYLQSLPGMGLKKAHALIKKFKSYDKVNIIGALKMLTSLEKIVLSNLPKSDPASSVCVSYLLACIWY